MVTGENPGNPPYEPHMRQSSLLLMEQTRVDMFFSTSAMSAAAAGATLTAACNTAEIFKPTNLRWYKHIH
jgi:hypothetical protein